jgi:hypothetical protein
MVMQLHWPVHLKCISLCVDYIPVNSILQSKKKIRILKWWPTLQRFTDTIQNSFIIPNSNPLNCYFPSAFFQPLLTSILLSVSVIVTSLGDTDKWNQTEFVLCVCLMSLSIMSSRSIHGAVGQNFLPF